MQGPTTPEILAALDRLIAGNDYPAEALDGMAGPYAEYLRARAELRALDLGEVAGAFTFRPGGPA